MSGRITDADRLAWAKRIERHRTKREIAIRLVDVMDELSRVGDTGAEINVLAHEIEMLLDARRGGTRERIDQIQRMSLGVYGNSVGMLEVGYPPPEEPSA